MATFSRPSLVEMGWQLARDANRTLGGGTASIELMRRSFSRRGWLDESGHALLVAVSRFTPGTNMLAYAAGLGWRVRGAAGLAVALAATSLPGSLAVTVLSAAVTRLLGWPGVRAAMAVATLVAAALVLSSAWALVRPHLRGPRPAWFVAIAAAAALLFAAGVTPVRVLVMAAAFGALRPGGETDA